MALSLNDLKKGKAGKSPSNVEPAHRMVRPWEDPTEQLTKQGTNREQIENKQVSEQGTNREQIENKQRTVPKEGTGKQGTEQGTSTPANREQIENKQGTKWPFEQLRGYEARLLQLVFDECQQTGALLSPPLTLDRIAESLETNKETAKTVVYRLAKKGLVKRENSAVGRGGYTCFRLEKELYQALLIRETGNKRRTNREQIENKQGTQQRTEQGTTASSSSSKDLDLNKLTTTRNEATFENLPPTWNAIDSTPLLPICFGRNQLSQLARLGKLTAEEVQDSIHAFAFDLEVNEKAKEINGAALNYFMGIMRKGPYAAPVNYEPPELRQRRLYLEAKERERRAREELDTKLEAVEFEEWNATVSIEEKTKLVPPTEFMKPGGAGYESQLKKYFHENVWPQVREKVMLGSTKVVNNIAKAPGAER